MLGLRRRFLPCPGIGQRLATALDYAASFVAHHIDDHAMRVTIHVHSHVEAQHLRVELPPLMNSVADDIWYNSSDAHRINFLSAVESTHGDGGAPARLYDSVL
jgi:hypothetical protein